MKPAPAPDCAFDPARASTSDAKLADGATADATLAQRIRLEYERDCYRRAEAKLRQRYLQLQLASRATAKAIKRLDQNDLN